MCLSLPSYLGIRVHDFQSAERKRDDNRNLLSLQVIFSPVIGKQSVCIGGYEDELHQQCHCYVLPADMRRQICFFYIHSLCVSLLLYVVLHFLNVETSSTCFIFCHKFDLVFF